MFFTMLDLPPPVARCTYSLYIKEILCVSACDALSTDCDVILIVNESNAGNLRIMMLMKVMMLM